MKKIDITMSLVMVAVVIAVLASVLLETAVVSVAAVLIGMAIMFALRTKDERKIKDELVYRISEKASRRAFQLFVLFAGITGAIIFLWDGAFAQFSQAAYTLFYSICLLLILYLIFYFIYSRKGL